MVTAIYIYLYFYFIISIVGGFISLNESKSRANKIGYTVSTGVFIGLTLCLIHGNILPIIIAMGFSVAVQVLNVILNDIEQDDILVLALTVLAFIPLFYI